MSNIKYDKVLTEYNIEYNFANALYRGQYDKALELKDNINNVNFRTKKPLIKGYTPLRFALGYREDDVKMVKLLLDMKADVNYESKETFNKWLRDFVADDTRSAYQYPEFTMLAGVQFKTMEHSQTGEWLRSVIQIIKLFIDNDYMISSIKYYKDYGPSFVIIINYMFILLANKRKYISEIISININLIDIILSYNNRMYLYDMQYIKDYII